MRKFILNLILFLIFNVLFYVVVLFISEIYLPSMIKVNINYRIGSPGHLYSRLSEVKKQKDIDILFLGSSHAYRGFDTRIFSRHGFKSFNLGSSAQTPIQTKVLLNRYLENINPKTVIYEVYPIPFELDGVESSLDIIANDKNDFNSLEMALKINNIKTYNTLIYGLVCDILNLNDTFSEPVIKGNDKYISGGFVEKKIGYFKPYSFEKEDISINEIQLQSFSQIVDILKNKNIDLILVYAPIPSTNYDRYTNNNYYDSIMENYSDYYNFNRILNLNDSLYFNDADHLNQNGVELFNKRLIEVINERKSATKGQP